MEMNFEAPIAERIARYVKSHWDEAQRPLPLGKVGAKLSAENLSTKTMFPQGGFAQFVKSKSKQYGFEVFQNIDRPEQIWLYPSGKISDPKLEDFLDPEPVRPKSYHSSLWSAFIDRSSENLRRFISIPPGSSYSDINEGAQPSAGWVEIQSRFLNTVGGYVPPQTVHERILRWAEENNIAAGIEISSAEFPAPKTHGNALENFLNELSDDQRKSLTLRADIVLSFLKR